MPTAAPIVSGQPRRLQGVDALRGVAASMIVVFHVIGLNQLKVPAALSFVPAYFGFGVPLFFIISAFSLFYTYFDRLTGTDQVVDYLMRRFTRIAPLFYAMLVVWILTAHFKFRQSVNPAELLANLAFFFNFIPAWQTSIVWAGWSIGVEFLFYALLPMLIALLRTTRASIIALVFCVGLAWSFQRSPAAPDYGFFKYGPFFAMGIVVWQFFRTTAVSARKLAATGSLAAAILFAAIMVWPGRISSFIWSTLSWRDSEFYLLGGVLALLVYSQALHPIIVISNRLTRFLGEISFSLYLLHPWIIMSCRPAYVFLAAKLSPGLCFCFATAGTFAVVVPAAWVSYRIIEAPGMALGKSWARNQQASAAKKNGGPVPGPAAKGARAATAPALGPQGS
jgi:peptidoglycan/LPS O-acetylase OafA/YrhL